MEIIARNDQRTQEQTWEESYMLTVETPNFGDWALECYALRLEDADELGQAFADLLHRIPTQDDDESFRDFWLTLVANGITPACCRVKRLRRVEGEGSEGHGWDCERYYTPSGV